MYVKRNRLRRSFFVGGDGGRSNPERCVFRRSRNNGRTKRLLMQTQEPKLICSDEYMSNIS